MAFGSTVTLGSEPRGTHDHTLLSDGSGSLLTSESQSQSYFTTGGLPPMNSFWRQAPWDSRHSNFIFQLNTCGYGPYVTSSLTRGWVCRLQVLLVLASAVILRSESLLYCLRFETPPIWRVRSPYLHPPGTGLPGYIPRHWVSLSSLPTTHRSTVEVFDPTSTRLLLLVFVI
jgi:hypothetical protein